jgi:GT2 family glycosyltransferase
MTTASVIIPVHNHAALTRRCLDALLAEAESVGADVVVVDDGSEDVTPELLARYDDAIRVVRHEEPLGFARACNAGARASRGELLVFLNNDTIPQPSWLVALVEYAHAHSEAAVVGARLLYPDRTVQHAGVAIASDGMPYHIYARFPEDDPAVVNPRQFQAVTGACMLVRRSDFARARGFSADYSNGWEDVDLCLRLGALDREVHYCPDCVVMHYESATRDTRAPDVRRSEQLFRERWVGRVRADDMEHYVRDGVLALRPAARYPFELVADPRVAVVDDEVQADRLEAIVVMQRQRLRDLERETLRLTVALAETIDVLSAPLPAPAFDVDGNDKVDADDVLLRYQRLLEGLTDGEFTASPSLTYRRLVREVRDAIVDATPPGSTVAVVTRGDGDLLRLDGRRGMHFPAGQDGEWLGHHPGDLAAIVAHFRRARAAGAEWFALPVSAEWWLEQYEGLRDFLGRYAQVRTYADVPCAIWSLAAELADLEPEESVR